eukprot:scaffold30710_cov109-Isochrysis_galbana.AAC.3
MPGQMGCCSDVASDPLRRPVEDEMDRKKASRPLQSRQERISHVFCLHSALARHSGRLQRSLAGALVSRWSGCEVGVKACPLSPA